MTKDITPEMVKEAIEFYREWKEPEVRAVDEVKKHRNTLLSLASQVLERGLGLTEAEIVEILDKAHNNSSCSGYRDCDCSRYDCAKALITKQRGV